MIITVETYLEQDKRNLKYWESRLKEVEEGTYDYDGTMPKSCCDALVKRKILIFEEALDYLETLPKDLIMYDGKGLSEEASHYYNIVNR